MWSQQQKGSRMLFHMSDWSWPWHQQQLQEPATAALRPLLQDLAA
jgi:hypothetical protein